MFFSAFNEEVREVFNEDKDKFLVMSWIIFRTNYQEEYNGLKKYQCYFSYSTIEEECFIKRKKTQRIMKELEEDEFITWFFKSKSRGKESILTLNKGYGLEYSLGYGSGYGLKVENTKIEDNKDMVKDTVKDMVEDTSSINISKNISKNISNNNIYSQKEEIPKEYLEIFNHWNSLKIIKHTDLTLGMEKAIKKALKKYDVETIKVGISNYNKIVKDESYYFNYKWSLEDFLNRAKGISAFLEDGERYINYVDDKERDKLRNEHNTRANKETKNKEYMLKGGKRVSAEEYDQACIEDARKHYTGINPYEEVDF